MSRPEVHVVRTWAELEALENEWNALSAPFATPLLDHDWCTCAALALHDERDLRVVTVRDSGVLTAVAPMTFDRSHRHLRLLGAAVLFEPSGWLFSSEVALGHLAGAVVDMGEVAVLERVPVISPLCTLMPRLVRGQAVTITRDTAASFGVRTNRDWTSYCSSLSSRTRQRLEADRARAERMGGEVRIQESQPGPGEVDEVLSTLVTVEAAGWKWRAGSALALRPDLLRFFGSYARRAAARRRLRALVLWVGDTPAAVELAVDSYGRRWGLKIAYDEHLASCAPALQVVHASIKSATEHGLAAYEFLGSAESWQERWRPERRAYQLAVVYPFRPRAMMTALHDWVSSVSRHIQRPQPLEMVMA